MSKNGNGKVNNNPGNPNRRKSVVGDPEHYPENAAPSFINSITGGPSKPGNKNRGGHEYFGPETQYPRNAQPLSPYSPYEAGGSNRGGYEYVGPFFKASPHLQKAVNLTKHEVPAYIPHAEPLAPLARPPSPGHKRLLVSGAPNIKIGAVHSASTRRRKAKKSKKSRKHRR
jgi:hypothetical protein